ncbi:MAG TPA: leucyl/phenylalanyl-tRNA--protein transferase [Acidimicrobiales bacterium]|nr:leucyl/phenylalanyl-tRNA--protein transferase [Acidimicrobiales bacterium]
MTPTDPGPSRWAIPSPVEADPDGPVAVGGDLEPATVLAAYRAGVFPMPIGRTGRVLAWWSPDPRGVIPLDGMRVTRSLRQAARRHHVTVDAAFDEVVRACADPRRPGAWITRGVRRAYTSLHELGWAHSVEAWTADGALAGGLYGVAVGGLFAGESMFHRSRDGSKVALLGLVDLLRDGGARLLDVQWTTAHLASLGAVDIPRRAYLDQLEAALQAPLPAVFGGPAPRPAAPAAGAGGVGAAGPGHPPTGDPWATS